mmetsp:Transcript_104064/g.264260  ORF Transcript_104064/g.264260 Transcript_104064/m.264260 type:complete len:285 (+) Transcript_104064:1076-1930(+)
MMVTPFLLQNEAKASFSDLDISRSSSLLFSGGCPNSCCVSVFTPLFFLVYSVSLFMECWLPCMRMKTMNSFVSTSPEQSSSTARQIPLRSWSLMTFAGMDRPGKLFRTTSKRSSLVRFPDPSASQALQTLYQFPLARCHLSAAVFIADTIRCKSISSSLGHVCSCNLYTALSNSIADASPLPSMSTTLQKAISWTSESNLCPRTSSEGLFWASPSSCTTRSMLRAPRKNSRKFARWVPAFSIASMKRPHSLGFLASTRTPVDTSHSLTASANLEATAHIVASSY